MSYYKVGEEVLVYSKTHPEIWGESATVLRIGEDRLRRGSGVSQP